MAGEKTASLRGLGRFVLVGVGYYASARLGLRLALIDDIVTPLWPPTGIAVAAFLAFGRRVWPAVALGAFAVNVLLADSPAVAAGISVGNTLAPMAAAALLHRLSFSVEMRRLRDALALVVVALATMTISASGGTASLMLGGASARVLDTWWVWWTGDAMGVLIVAPVVWSVARIRFGAPNWARIAEAACLFSTLAVATVLASTTEDGFLFVALPLLGWIAWRFQLQGAAAAGLLASGIVIAAAANDWGVLAPEPLQRRMVLLQLFNACVALTCAVFAAAVNERREIQQALYERERNIAQTLQRSLLPQLPVRDDIDMAARYAPASGASEVGGDWYDVIPLPNEKLGLVVGDVVGHGIGVAAAMTQLRVGLRAFALACQGPAATLHAVNRMVNELLPGTMATVLYAELDPTTTELRFANAGHLSPLVLTAGREGRYLESRLAAPIGVADALDCGEGTAELPAGSTLVLFTDGLIERRDVALDESLERLRRVGADGPADLEALCDRILAEASLEDTIDDVALLAIRLVSIGAPVRAAPGTRDASGR